MISKEEYNILLRCIDEPQEQEKGKDEEYASLAKEQGKGAVIRRENKTNRRKRKTAPDSRDG